MRGKHGASAAKRHTEAELLARAEKAEHAEARLTAELAELKASSERKILALRAEVRQVAAERDAAASPALKAECERNAVLAEELREERRNVAHWRLSYEEAGKTYTSAYADCLEVLHAPEADREAMGERLRLRGLEDLARARASGIMVTREGRFSR